METKFKQTQYGFELVITPKTSDEIAIMSNLVIDQKNPGRIIRLLNIQPVIKNYLVESISICEDVYLSQKLIIAKGYTLALQNNWDGGSYIYYKISNQYTYILFGSGLYYLLKIENNSFEFSTYTEVNLNGNVIALSNDVSTCRFKVYKNNIVQTLNKLNKLEDTSKIFVALDTEE